MDGFAKIRNGLIDHIQEGKMCPFDLGIYVFLHLRADWTTGIAKTCAATISYQFSDPSLTKQIQRSLHRLRARGYINYREGSGKRGGYDILIHKYRVAVGGLSGCELNAWKNGKSVKAEYERAGGCVAVDGRSCGGDGAVVRPNLDFKTLKEVEDKPLEVRRENQNPFRDEAMSAGFRGEGQPSDELPKSILDRAEKKRRQNLIEATRRGLRDFTKYPPESWETIDCSGRVKAERAPEKQFADQYGRLKRA